MSVENEKYSITGMSCSSCVAHVEKAVKSLNGINECSVNLLTNSMLVSYSDSVNSSMIINAVNKAGYKARLADKKKENIKENDDNSEIKQMMFRLISSLILLVPLFYIGMGYMLNMEYGVIFPLGAFGENEFYVGLTEMALALIIMIINKKFFISGFKAVINKSPNMDTLVALGSSVAFIYSFIMMFVMSYYAKNNAWDNVMKASMNLSFETSGMVPTLITIGKTLETYSKGKTTSAIKALLDLAPKKARIIKDNQEVLVDIDEVKVGDIFIVLPGESFPVDGEVIEGVSSVNEAAITGESMPVDKSVGSKVSSATINQNGALKCKATKVGDDTALNQIVKMVENASSTKTKISAIADKVAGVFVPVVLTIALIVFLCWLIFGGEFISSLNNSTLTITYAIERAISVLVISCPCALGLATPVAIMVGNGIGAKHGILFKTASALEACEKVSFVVLDKTGTITKGEPTIKNIYPIDISEEELLLIAASLESKSEHPLAKAIIKKSKEKNLSLKECLNFQAVVGHGVIGEFDNHIYQGGNINLVKELNLLDENLLAKNEEYTQNGETPLFFIEDKKVLGIISISDEIKEDSKDAIEELNKLGVTTIMLTGDNKQTARAIAKEVNVKNFIAEVLPDQKLEVIKKLQSKGIVMMVGDGINDAPSLTQADIGVAIGAGSDIAIDSADIVLTKSTLMDVVYSIKLSKRVMRNIKENLFWAFFYNLVMIPIAAGVFSTVGLTKLRPWMSAAAMSLSSITVVLNALRLNLIKVEKTKSKKRGQELPLDILDTNFKYNYVKTVKITGMMCENCVKHVTEALNTLDSVVKVNVSLKDKNAVIYSNNEVEDKKIIEVIKKAGYNVKI